MSLIHIMLNYLIFINTSGFNDVHSKVWNNSKISSLNRLFSWSGFKTRLKNAIASDPDDNVESLRAVYRVTYEWTKDVNIQRYKSLKEICFLSCEFFFEWNMVMCQWEYLESFPFIDFNCASFTGVCIFYKKNAKCAS